MMSIAIGVNIYNTRDRLKRHTLPAIVLLTIRLLILVISGYHSRVYGVSAVEGQDEFVQVDKEFLQRDAEPA